MLDIWFSLIYFYKISIFLKKKKQQINNICRCGCKNFATKFRYCGFKPGISNLSLFQFSESSGGGVWAVYPVVFSISYFCGIFHSSITVILSMITLSMFSLAAFNSPGTPPIIEWGSYPVVGKGYLENYTFCHYCSKPKSPRAHHCSSCGMCILDMDHHCPFVSVYCC